MVFGTDLEPAGYVVQGSLGENVIPEIDTEDISLSSFKKEKTLVLKYGKMVVILK